MFFSLLATATLFSSIFCGVNKNNFKSVSATAYNQIVTEVNSINVHSQDSGYAFAFYLSVSDYGTKSYITSITGVSELNFLEKISFEGKTSYSFTGERFINVWGHNGAFVLRTGSGTKNYATDLKKITIYSGCQFPSYDYGSGVITTPTCYVTNKDLVFVNDGNGNFSLDPRADEYEIPEGYTAIDTEITGLREQNHTDMMSFLQFELSTSDYGSVSSTTSVRSFSSLLQELKFMDYIYINNKPMSSYSENKYNLESFVNLFGVSPSFAIRTKGNNTGCYYKSSGTILETADLTAYEVVIGLGCAFPSYSYLIGSTSTPTCYINTKTVRFIWENGQYVKIENYKEPDWIENNVVSVSSHGSNADTAIDFEMEEFDFPTTSHDVVFDKTQFNLSFFDRIAIVQSNGTIYSSLSTERFANVWAGDTGHFSIRKPVSLSWKDIRCVVIYSGCEFPTYGCYNDGKNTRYITTETSRFYSNGDGTFYKSNNITADEFSSLFMNRMSLICHDYDGVANNKEALDAAFLEMASTYQYMSLEEKNLIIDTGSSSVKTMLTFYDYVMKKYNLSNDFLSRKSKYNAMMIKEINNESSYVSLIVSLSAATFGVLCICIIFFKKRKMK